MNNPRRLGILLILIIGIACGVERAVADPALVQFPTGYASWTVDVKTHGSVKKVESPAPAPGTPGGPEKMPKGARPAPADQRQIQKIEVTQTGNLCRSVITWNTGNKTEAWYLKSPPWAMVDNPDKPGDVFLTSLVAALPMYCPDADLFKWVADQWSTGKSSYGDKECQVYQRAVPLENQAPSFLTGRPEVVTPHTAWIDEKTALPVALDNGVAVYIFTFNPPPVDPLVLPDRFQQELTRAQESIPNPKYLGKPRSWAKD
jgi:hypothetical protein